MSYESHKYYNGNLYANNAKDVKNQQLFIDLRTGIAMEVKKPTTMTTFICGYCNGCKKINIYYKTHMQVLQWL